MLPTTHASLFPGQPWGKGHRSNPVHPVTRAGSSPACLPHHPPGPRLLSPTSTCWQICISLAIWFSSSLLRLTRLVRFVSRVCCESRNGRGEREKRKRSAKPEDCPRSPISDRDHLPPNMLPEGATTWAKALGFLGSSCPRWWVV